MKLDWSKPALRTLSSISKQDADRILTKMDWFVTQEDPLHFAKTLQNNKYGTHRFRIGNYRVFCKTYTTGIQILYVHAIRKRNEKTYKN